MRSALRSRPACMTTTQQQQLTGEIAVAMFTVADVDAAIAHYTTVLGFELRADVRFGEEGDQRWVEVAPAGSSARVALNPPMGPFQPGGSGVGIEVDDVHALHDELAARGADVQDVMSAPGAPTLFMAGDPDGNCFAFTQREA